MRGQAKHVLTINRKITEALGLAVSAALVVRADEVLE